MLIIHVKQCLWHLEKPNLFNIHDKKMQKIVPKFTIYLPYKFFLFAYEVNFFIKYKWKETEKNDNNSSDLNCKEEGPLSKMIDKKTIHGEELFCDFVTFLLAPLVSRVVSWHWLHYHPNWTFLLFLWKQIQSRSLWTTSIHPNFATGWVKSVCYAKTKCINFRVSD